MDTQHDNALTHALAAIAGPVPPSGVLHAVIPHTSRFTVVGNHLAQHAELSLVAIGIGVHIQSLPAGSKVGIKALAARFPEGEVKIACALRELEAHGYLHRPRMRLAKGRVATRTVFCNQPGAVLRGGVVPVVGLRYVVPGPHPLPYGNTSAYRSRHRCRSPPPYRSPAPYRKHRTPRSSHRRGPRPPSRVGRSPTPTCSPRSCGRPPPRSSPICDVTRRSWCSQSRTSRS